MVFKRAILNQAHHFKERNAVGTPATASEEKVVAMRRSPRKGVKMSIRDLLQEQEGTWLTLNQACAAFPEYERQALASALSDLARRDPNVEKHPTTGGTYRYVDNPTLDGVAVSILHLADDGRMLIEWEGHVWKCEQVY